MRKIAFSQIESALSTNHCQFLNARQKIKERSRTSVELKIKYGDITSLEFQTVNYIQFNIINYHIPQGRRKSSISSLFTINWNA
jgi:hypothetical protein